MLLKSTALFILITIIANSTFAQQLDTSKSTNAKPKSEAATDLYNEMILSFIMTLAG